MREIKFRIWGSGQMWYKDSKTVDGNDVLLEFFNGGIGWGLYDSKLKNRLVTGDPMAIFNSPGSLMQYSGLQDREKKDIYEGDIVSLRYWHNNSPSKRPKKEFITVQLPVIFLNGQFQPDDQELRSTQYGTSYGNWYEHCEVIGNIYENPELIKQQ